MSVNLTSPRGASVLSHSKYFYLIWPLSSISQLSPWNTLFHCLLLQYFAGFSHSSFFILLSSKCLELIFFLHYNIPKWFIWSLPMTSVIYTDNLKCVSTAHIFVLSPKPICLAAYYSSPLDYLTSTSTQMSTIKFMILSIDLFLFWSSLFQ